MSIFNDKALKGVAAEVAKIMAETSQGSTPKTPKEKSLAALAHPKDKITHKDVLVGRGVLKKEETEQLDEAKKKPMSQDEKDKVVGAVQAAMRKSRGNVIAGQAQRAAARLAAKVKSGMKEEVELNEETEQLQEYESKGGVYKHKGNYGTSYKTDEEGNEIKPAKQKGYGARQNYVRGTSTGEKKKMKEELSFTEMLELYNEHGLKVLAPIEKEEQQIGDQTVEVIDADKVNGVVATIVEEPTEEEFNKELKDQQDSFAGKKKQPKVAAGKTTGVKVMPEETELDEEIHSPGTKVRVPHKGKMVSGKVVRHDKGSGGYSPAYVVDVGEYESKIVPSHKVQKEEVEQIDEISADLAGKYLTAPQGKGANKYKVSSDKSVYPNIETMSKHSTNVRRALKRSEGSSLYKKPDYYKEETELDERTLTSGETKKKEEYVKGMKKGLSGFKQRYGERAKSVMYATATKMAKKD